MSYKKNHCQGFHPANTIVCGPDPLSGTAPPCVKFPTDIISPTWNSWKYQNIKKTRVVPNPTIKTCTKTYQPAIQTNSLCPFDVVLDDPNDPIPPMQILNIQRSGCECGPATVTRVRVGQVGNGATLIGIVLSSEAGEIALPLNGDCVTLSVEEQIAFNQTPGGVEVSVQLQPASQNIPYIYRYSGICFALSAVTYTFNIYEDTEGVCPIVATPTPTPTPP